MCNATSPFIDFDAIFKLDRRSYALYGGFHSWRVLNISRTREGLGIWKRGRLLSSKYIHMSSVCATGVTFNDLRYFILFEPS
jgi:hypothetical protein